MTLLRVLRSFLNGSGRNMLSVKAYKSRETRGRVFPVPRCGQERGERFSFGHIVSKNMRGRTDGATGNDFELVSKSWMFSVFLTTNLRRELQSLKTFWTSPWVLRFISHTRLWTLSHCIIVVMKWAEDKSAHDTRTERISVWSAHKIHFSPKIAKCTKSSPI